MSAVIISDCGKYRYRLERQLDYKDGYLLDYTGRFEGQTIAFFGINPSTADATINDQTVKKWIGFCKRWGAKRFIAGNVFAYRSKDVAVLRDVEDPFGPAIGDSIQDIISDSDILVPCWGNTDKVPPRLRFAFDVLLDTLIASKKPVMTFGLTKSGDPMHPQMLGYDTLLVEWRPQ